MNFKVGDVVRVISGLQYAVTTKGSVGVITSLSDFQALIKFSEIASHYQSYVGDTFAINLAHVELFVQLPLEVQVLNKVNQIHARQLKRGIL